MKRFDGLLEILTKLVGLAGMAWEPVGDHFKHPQTLWPFLVLVVGPQVLGVRKKVQGVINAVLSPDEPS